MESPGKIPWYLVNDPDRGMIKNDSTTAIRQWFSLYRDKDLSGSQDLFKSALNYHNRVDPSSAEILSMAVIVNLVSTPRISSTKSSPTFSPLWFGQNVSGR